MISHAQPLHHSGLNARFSGDVKVVLQFEYLICGSRARG
jgi:hypothetical protein